MPEIAQPAACQLLRAQVASVGKTHLAELFAADPGRFDAFHRRVGPLLLDFSKQRITAETLAALCKLADARGLRDWQARLFGGEPVNHTEQRQALHWALRQPRASSRAEDSPAPDHSAPAALAPLIHDIHHQQDAMATMVARFHSGQWQGATGKPITAVVNLGVGGSHLGPLMATRALVKATHPAAPALHFVSTLDGSDLGSLLPELDPHTTLFIVSSKSFGTIDTLSNAETARAWLRRTLGVADDALMAGHFIGVSARTDAMAAWGIPPQNRLQLWDWVGGRYSMWGTTGLPLALAIGMEAFHDLLAGAHAIDTHTRQAPWHDNLPVLMALIGHWNINYLGIHVHAVLPYDGRLRQLPAYLMQLEMESNGKRVSRDDQPLDHHTCPLVFGDSGTNGQHSFFQLLHQGTEAVACDFIVAASPGSYAPDEEAGHWQQHHQLSQANCLAQSRLLALGDSALDSGDRTLENGDSTKVPNHRRYPGNQPSSTLVLDELTPYTLGALIALYEHKVFTQAVLWDINPFDQWGVEMGKNIAAELLAPLQGGQRSDALDSSTQGLLNTLQGKRHP